MGNVFVREGGDGRIVVAVAFAHPVVEALAVLFAGRDESLRLQLFFKEGIGRARVDEDQRL